MKKMLRSSIGQMRYVLGVLAVSWALVGCATPTGGDPSVTPTAGALASPQSTATLSTVDVPPSSTPFSTPTSELTAPPAAPSQPGRTYTVQPGDTLLGIAMDHDVPMAALQLANDLGTSTAVQVDQGLTLPVASPWSGASPFWVLYEVVSGDTLIGIADTYGVDLAALQSVNDLNPETPIQVDQLLVLPVDGPAVARAVSTPTPAPTVTPVPPTPLPTPTTAPLEATPTPTIAPTSPPPVAVEPPPADVSAWTQEVFRLINETRAAHGLSPFTYNPLLENAAQAHANDCAQRGWGSHTGSDGADIKTRIRRAGYEGAGWAECWTQRKTPADALHMWMDEIPPNDPHRRTILSTWLTEIGIGVARDDDWGYFFIANFGRP